MRWPVAAKIAFSTAGAATKIVGSPIPPQPPWDGMMLHSTFSVPAVLDASVLDRAFLVGNVSGCAIGQPVAVVPLP
jgi:hypothetical protein